MIKIHSYINNPYDGLGLGDVHKHALEAVKPGVKVAFVDEDTLNSAFLELTSRGQDIEANKLYGDFTTIYGASVVYEADEDVTPIQLAISVLKESAAITAVVFGDPGYRFMATHQRDNKCLSDDGGKVYPPHDPIDID